MALPGKSFMIAITGGSGSGKTTLARALHHKLGEDKAALMTEDNYYFGREHYGAAALKMSHAELESTFDFDSPSNKDMAHLRRDIEALKRGEAVEQPVYDFPSHDRKKGAFRRFESRPVVIVGGRDSAALVQVATALMGLPSLPDRGAAVRLD